MKTRPFDLEAAKQGAKLVTRDGKTVRILCYDRKSEGYPIIALVDRGECEDYLSFTSNGYYAIGEINDNDLLILDESDSMPELSDIMKKLDELVAEAHELVERLKQK